MPKNQDLLVAASTIWVVVTAVLVIFMQAGFAFLEAGLTRMKNAGHIAGKNVLIFAIASLVYYFVGFGLAFGDGNGFVGTAGFFPSVEELTAVGKAPFDWFSEIPGAAGYLFEVAFAGVSWRSSGGRWPSGRSSGSTSPSGSGSRSPTSVVSHWIWSPHGWLFKHGMQDFAGSTVVHYQGALAALAGALILGPRIGKFGTDGRANPIPGHNIPFAVLGTIILWFGWFGFNPGSTLSVDFGGFGYFAYVALTTNIAAAAGAVTGMCVAWARLGKPDISMMLNGTLGALVAITAASGFVAPWAAIVIGVGSGFIAVFGVILVEKIKIDDPIGAVAVHGMSGVWGTLATGLFAVPALADKLATGQRRPRLHRQLPPTRNPSPRPGGGRRLRLRHQLRRPLRHAQALGHPRRNDVETGGLDVHEHGMWGYPEFYIPVPGGYGTESHGHLGAANGHAANGHASVPVTRPAAGSA